MAGVPARGAAQGAFCPGGWGGKWRGEPQCRQRIDSAQSEAGWWPQPGTQGLAEQGELRAHVVLTPSGSLGWPGPCGGRGMGAVWLQAGGSFQTSFRSTCTQTCSDSDAHAAHPGGAFWVT